MKIITISREFGSGGRELAKRLADSLGFAYYDKEIVSEIADKCDLDENFVENTLNRGFTVSYPYSFRSSFSKISPLVYQTTLLSEKRQSLLLKIAEKGEDCIIVGQGADVLLSQFSPLKLFVYADLESKIQRCKNSSKNDENLSEKEIKRLISDIDRQRASAYNKLSPSCWGDKCSYHLCINTSRLEIKSLISSVCLFADTYFKNNSQ